MKASLIREEKERKGEAAQVVISLMLAGDGVIRTVFDML